jgi:hypothetical protein
MAYLRPIAKPRCACGALATCELVNAQNAPCGSYCRRCGKRELHRFLGAESPAARALRETREAIQAVHEGIDPDDAEEFRYR